MGTKPAAFVGIGLRQSLTPRILSHIALEDRHAMNSPQKNQRNILFAAAVLVIGAVVGAAFFFGETSPLIASGRVKLAPTLIEQAKGIRTLFIIVRDADSPMPMPWGAMSTTLSKEIGEDVYQFTLTQDNLRVMNRGGDLPKKLIIKARLDVDGMGGVDMPGDLTGSVSDIPFGSKDVTITINNLIGEGTPLASP